MDSETVRLFEEDGYLTAIPIHGPEEVKGIRDQFNVLENAEGKENFTCIKTSKRNCY